MPKKIDADIEIIKNLFNIERKNKKEIADILNLKYGTLLAIIKRSNIKLVSYRQRNITNEIFGRLTAIQFIGKNKFGFDLWSCKCNCGKQKEVTRDSLLCGRTKSCGCYKLELNFKGIGEMSSSHWSHIKDQAKRRKIEFNVSIEELWNKFSQQNGKCALSGLSLLLFKDQTYWKKQTASLDRIDSTKGYIMGNVQWVHKDINMMKHKYNEKYFIDMCCLIADNYKNKNE